MFGFVKKMFPEKEGFHVDETVEMFRDATTLTLLSFDGSIDHCSLGLKLKKTVKLIRSESSSHTFLFHAENVDVFNNDCLHFSTTACLDIGYMFRNGFRQEQYLRVTFSYDTGRYLGVTCFGDRSYIYGYEILDADTFCITSHEEGKKVKASFKIGRGFLPLEALLDERLGIK